jgi:predicted membrane protein
MASKIVHVLPRFPQGLKEILGGAVIGFAICFIFLVPLSFLTLAIMFVALIVIAINAGSK